MKITKIVAGLVETNTYILDIAGDVLVIDPCLDAGYNSDRLLKPLEGKNVLAVLLTHGHFDHISGVDVLVHQFHCPVYMYHEEVHYLKSQKHNLSSMTAEPVSIQADPTPIECEPLDIGPFSFDVVLTKGHTSGCISYVFENDIFDGDFIFQGTVGRMDFPTGSEADMRASIEEFIEMFGDHDYNLYPGHGDITSLHREMASNPFCQ